MVSGRRIPHTSHRNEGFFLLDFRPPAKIPPMLRKKRTAYAVQAEQIIGHDTRAEFIQKTGGIMNGLQRNYPRADSPKRVKVNSPLERGIRWLVSFGLVLMLVVVVPAPVPAQPKIQKRSRITRALRELQRDLRAIIERPSFATTRWGILVESLDGRQVIFSHNPTQLFTPASNMKLYTTAAALVHLGPDFRFRTSVYATAKPDERGHLEGDLILYGRGDPNLSTRTVAHGVLTPLSRLADQLYDAGVRDVFGDIVGDESYFVGPRLGVAWEWDDLQWYYGTEVSALTLDDNAVEIIIQPGSQIGEPARLYTRPERSYVTILNHVVTVESGAAQRIIVDRPLGGNTVEVWGTIPLTSLGYRASLAISDPARYAAHQFRQELLRRGIRVHGQATSADWRYRREHPLPVSSLVELAFVESIPLREEIRVLNKISQNLHAELLLRTLGAVVKKEGSDTRGLEVVSEFLQSLGARMQGIRFRDGSGLSRQNLISPTTTVDLLRGIRAHPQGDIFLASLPVAGEDGTLERRMRETPAAGRVRAKTGTLAYTYTLSGYLTTISGRELVFSIMVNDHTGEAADAVRAIDEICARLSAFTDR